MHRPLGWVAVLAGVAGACWLLAWVFVVDRPPSGSTHLDLYGQPGLKVEFGADGSFTLAGGGHFLLPPDSRKVTLTLLVIASITSILAGGLLVRSSRATT
jgi:hypothetical protein